MSHVSNFLPNLVAIGVAHCASTTALKLLRSGTAWPQICTVGLAHNQLDANAISVMLQARWTNLSCLNHNMIGASGVQHLVACSWPCGNVLPQKYKR